MSLNDRKPKTLLPFLFAVVLAFGMYLGAKMNASKLAPSFFEFKFDVPDKIGQMLNYIDKSYVDSVAVNELEDAGINGILKNLDPHSLYIPSRELKAVNEPLEGKFEGIGIEFNIINDTIVVVAPISGGPSEALGIRSGDRIVRIDEEVVAGIGIKNSGVIKRLRGTKGTKVRVQIFRRYFAELIDYVIVRDKIPIYSVDVGYKLNDETGYIKISRFSATTYDEFLDKLIKLQQSGLNNLILDLRGNPGGYLNAATLIADEFLQDKSIIVYTKGKEQPQHNYYSTTKGRFKKGNLVVMIDEGSASASEIVAGAVQDLDRGIIVGRRSFGKGLVQDQTEFSDGSALRLTVARYYTPTGRCIQKPYKSGLGNYRSDLLERYERGEFYSADSVDLIDSLQYKTPEGRIVYGGGGIMPDVFVPLDTVGSSPYLNRIFYKGVIHQFTFNYADENRKLLNEQFADPEGFKADFQLDDEIFRSFVDFAAENGVNKKWNEIWKSQMVIKTHLKALIARQLWGNDGYFPIFHDIDKALQKSLEVISNNELVFNSNK